jgi:fructuronate reductase
MSQPSKILAAANLAALPASVARPAYDFAAQKVGIVHFGIGAFHRAHMAWYTDAAMAAGERDWRIMGVSLRSAGVAEQMNPQDGLYTVSERSAAVTDVRVIGSVAGVLVATTQREEVIAAIAAPTTHIVSFTVTEKGYCRASDGSLDLTLAAAGFYPLLVEAMQRRRDAAGAGLTLLSCDNLADNGRQLARLMAEYLAAAAPELSDWFAANCTCPATMIDRIVPATTDADRAELAGALGMEDKAAVLTEQFSQWVIEDHFAGPRPRWEDVGAQIVANVAPYETAKLRMLNGAHSMLAYCGLQAGYDYVHQAVADPALRALAEQLMLQEAAPTITAAEGQDLPAYAAALLDRFANPALNHRLIQIAMDGSQKIPQRWLETLAWHQNLGHQQRGRQCPAIMAGIAAWIHHLSGANGPVDDPLATELSQAVCAADLIAALFGPNGIMASEWSPKASAV